MDRITDLLRQGRKLDAIRAYRQLTGGSLQQAYTAIDALERGETPPAASSAAASPEADTPLAELRLTDWEREALALIKQQRKLEAIKLVRERTGQDLQTAMETVDRLNHGWRTRWRPLPPTGDPIRDLLQQGRKIDAMKLYLQQHRVGLKQAKDALDAMEQEMGLR